MIMRVVSIAALATPLFAAGGQEVVARHCLGCHGAAKMGGLDLRSRETMLAGGKRGAALVPGKAAESLLFRAVARQGDVQMPPGKQALGAADVEAVRAWIDAGAPWNAAVKGGELDWWSLKKVRRPEVPKTAANPVDAFVLAKLTEKGLKPVALADRRTLIRRAYFDLHGLPPSPDEVEKFVADGAPDAWAKLVERLLESPRYGERWGRHWLDVVRYADTGGFETDIYFPNAWRYRDYVVKAFNQDKPFNRFVQEQVAGDELWPDNLDLPGGFDIPKEKLEHLDARIATGMYTIGPVYHEAALNGDQVRYEWLTDVVDTTGEAFLGLTMGCSRCHDHKFDPLTRVDYHRLMAVFAGSEEKEIPVVSRFSIFGFKSGYPNYLMVEELKAAVSRIDRGARDRVVSKVRSRFSAEVLAAYDVPDQKRSPEQRMMAAKLELAMTEAGLKENAEGKTADIPYTEGELKEKDRLIRELGLASLKANPVMQTATVLGRADFIPDVHLTSRGEWRVKGEKMSPGLPAAIGGGAVESAERRKALALWLTDPAHPLTARVIVNRVWHWHFGRGIVATPNDFGRQGEPPTHPELLDWLASEFVREGWSLKKLHRLILMSETYRRGSAPDDANSGIDAQNRYLWRANRGRLDAEALRDAVLAVSGKLNLKMGGRPVIPPLSKEEYSTMWARNQWPEAMDPAEHGRRTVYLYVKRSFPMPMLTAFDQPDTSVSCARRDVTTVAPQALALMNGEFMLGQARHFAERLQKEGDRAQWVDRAWRLALGRAPKAEEARKAEEFFTGGATPEALQRLCLVLFNTNEFVYVD
ncbi:MAG: PSD1 and planctomycete cytochrome C domain-containing protein [Bryobacteraceae bacterium]